MTDALCESNLISKDDRVIYRYGIEIALLKCIHIVTMLVIGLALGLFLETAVFIVSYSVLRIYAGGFHAKTKTGCYIISWIMIIVVLSAVKFCPVLIARQGSLIGFIVSAIIILYLSPMDNPNKPLDALETKYYKKAVRIILACESVVFLLFFFLDIPRFLLIICISLMSVSVMLLLRKAQMKLLISTSFHNGPIE